MVYKSGDGLQAQTNTRKEFLESWAKKYFDTIDWIEGNESGGIDPPRHLKECFVKDDNTVIIKWNLPATTGAGIVNLPYHVTDYDRIRTDELVFGDDRILENGKDRLQEYKDGGCFEESKDKAVEFQREYAVASKVYNMKHSADTKTIGSAEKLEMMGIKSQDTRVYMFTWEAEDEDGKIERSLEDITGLDEDKSASQWTEELRLFLGQTNETYVDKWGVVHEIYEDKDQPFAYYFEVHDGDWEEVIGNMGENLDDSLNKDMPEDIRQGFADIYNHAMKQAKLQELSAKTNSLNDFIETKGMRSYSMVDENYCGEPELGEEDYEAYREVMDLEV